MKHRIGTFDNVFEKNQDFSKVLEMFSIFLVVNFHFLHGIVSHSMECVPRNLIGKVLYNIFEIANRFRLLLVYFCFSVPQKKLSSRFKFGLLAGQLKSRWFEITCPLNLPLRKSMTSLYPCPILMDPKAFFPLYYWYDMGFEHIEVFCSEVFMEQVNGQDMSINYSRLCHHLCCPLLLNLAYIAGVFCLEKALTLGTVFLFTGLNLRMKSLQS